MRIESIDVEGVKGITGKVTLQTKYLLLSGPMGSGKSAVLDAIALVLQLPTKFGKTNLGRISPTGSWRVAIKFHKDDEHGVRALERACKNGKNSYLVGGMKASEQEYSEAVARVILVDDQHVSLDSFIGLSGEKRAGMFAGMIAGDELHTLDDVFEPSVLKWVSDDERGEHIAEHFDKYLDRFEVMAGTANELSEGVKVISNELRTGNRDARNHLDKLILQQVETTHGMTPEELKARVEGADVKIGGIKVRKENLDIEAERFDSAKKVLTAAETVIGNLCVSITTSEAAGVSAEGHRQTINQKMVERDQFSQRRGSTETQLEEWRLKQHASSAVIQRLEDGKVLLEGLMANEWEVDDEWLEEEFSEMTHKTVEAGHSSEIIIEWGPEVRLFALKFVKEVVAEQCGGSVEKIVEKLVAAVEEHAVVQDAVDSRVRTLKDDTKAFKHAESQLRSLNKLLDKDKLEFDKLDGLKTDLEARTKDKISLEAATQRTGVTSDPNLIEHELTLAEDVRNQLATQLRELEDAKAISGQIEEQRAYVAAYDEVVTLVKLMAEKIQEWRDNAFREQLSTIAEPFIDAFGKLFPGSKLEIDSSGTGRSTKFDFIVRKTATSPPVPLELLSDGETVLAAAAFLSALQSVKEGPGRILLLNTESLDERGTMMAINRFPQLGFDFIGMANNRVGNVEDGIWTQWVMGT